MNDSSANTTYKRNTMLNRNMHRCNKHLAYTHYIHQLQPKNSKTSVEYYK